MRGMEFSLPVAVGSLVVLVVLGAAGLIGGGMMALQTTLTMVVPSMLLFGGIAFLIGMKHGEFRAA